MNKIPVVAVVGPTASGKTALAAALAQYYGAEVISADSMQIYRGMDIATAKPTAEETAFAPHHLIGFLDPRTPYSVSQFCADAKRAAEDIVSRGKRVIVAGGTGLYVDALLSGMRFEEEAESEAVRRTLAGRKESEGIDALRWELTEIDPDLAAQMDLHNEKRVLRALEIYYATGRKPSAVRKEAVACESDFKSLYIGLFYGDRALLYERIDRRVDLMMEQGLAEEARLFFAANIAGTAVQAIGYKELKPWLDGAVSREEAVENLKRATRRYAKRQITWFKRNPALHVIYKDSLSDAAVFDAARTIIDTSRFFEGRPSLGKE